MAAPLRMEGQTRRPSDSAYHFVANPAPIRLAGALAPATTPDPDFERVRISGGRIVRVVAKVSSGTGNLVLHRILADVSDHADDTSGTRSTIGTITTALSAGSEVSAEIEPKGEEYIDVELTGGATVTFVDVFAQ